MIDARTVFVSEMECGLHMKSWSLNRGSRNSARNIRNSEEFF